MESTGLGDHVRRKVEPDTFSAACRRRASNVAGTSRDVEYTGTFLDTGGIQQRLGKCGRDAPKRAVVFVGCRVPTSLLKVAKRLWVEGRWCRHAISLLRSNAAVHLRRPERPQGARLGVRSNGLLSGSSILAILN